MNYKYAVILSILDIPMLYNFDNIIYNFPKNCFGVFVTIKRNNKVHGCIGKWEYNVIDDNQIFKYMINVAHSASFNDSRSKAFNDIINDPNAEIEINFLLNDFKIITNIFDNDKYGVIVKRNNKYLATYLPKVFSSQTSWDYIKNSLINKAHTSNNNLEFISYPTNIIKFKLVDLLKDKEFRLFWAKKISENLEFKNNDIPHTLKNNKFYYIHDNIRNISSLNTMIKYAKLNNDSNLKKYQEILKSYGQKYQEYDMQTLSFLVDLVDTDPEVVDYFCNHSKINIDNQEKKFAKPEILLAMCTKCKLDNEYLNNKMLNLLSERENDIFQYNWHSKFFKCLSDKNQLKLPNKNKILNEVLNMYNPSKKYETNELAVMFECYMNTYSFINDIKLYNKAFTLFILALRRINSKYWLNFNNKEARLDITIHVLDAFIN